MPPVGYCPKQFRAAYLLYFVPTGTATVLHVLQRSGVLPRIAGRPLRVLDLGSGPLTATLAEIEAQVIRARVEACGGNKRQAAESLGIDRGTLYNRLRS